MNATHAPNALYRTDASEALVDAGFCISRANLAAALLRAHGIPARTVAHLPTWTEGDKIIQHWLVEYWSPTVDWIGIEPTMGVFQPDPTTLIELVISSPRDENRSFSPEAERSAAPGVPDLCMPQWSANLQGMEIGTADATNYAAPVARIDGTEKEMTNLFRLATHRFPRLLSLGECGNIPDSTVTILAAAKTGSSTRLLDCLNRAYVRIR